MLDTSHADRKITLGAIRRAAKATGQYGDARFVVRFAPDLTAEVEDLPNFSKAPYRTCGAARNEFGCVESFMLVRDPTLPVGQWKLAEMTLADAMP